MRTADRRDRCRPALNAGALPALAAYGQPPDRAGHGTGINEAAGRIAVQAWSR